MAKVQLDQLLPPALGGLGGIIISDMVGDWISADVNLSESTARWGRIAASVATGIIGLIGLKGSANMRTAGVAFAGSAFGLALTDFLAQMGWVKQG